MKIFLLFTLLCSSAFAMDSSKCSNLLNNGLYKKYKWHGMGEANTKAITGETKSSNFLSAISKVTTEGSTVTVDPKYSSNVSTSQSQSMSSWGDCSAFALEERKEQRDLYVEQNLDQIKKDMANGQGDHLEVLSWFSFCDESAKSEFNQTMQQHMSELLVTDSKTLNKNIDGIIKTSSSLSNKCYVLTAK